MNKFQRWKNIMKCYPFEEKRLAKWEPPYIVQPKYDGVRCRAVPLENGEYILLSSEENVIFSVPHINAELNSSSLPRIEYDGELYCHGMSFEQIVSITSRTVNIHPNHKSISFHIFDTATNKCQSDRITNLFQFQDDFKSYLYLNLSPFWLAMDLEDIMKVYNKVLDENYEGIIVRHYMASYERKRSLYIMKFKPKKEDNYLITGFQEEVTISNLPKNQLGTLICDSGDGNIFSIGSGFTEDQRKNLWVNRDKLIGKSVKVQYQHLTSGKKVPRFPVFMEIVNA